MVELEYYTLERLTDMTEPVESPIPWSKYNLSVIRDGYTEDGVRIHIVRGGEYKTPVMLGNVIVISENKS
ncbi:hypothetical protein KUA24_35 [Vibrio phage HNL01]|nr:hypothetical protein KUA24_35 [Vibrio phage HNL01]